MSAATVVTGRLLETPRFSSSDRPHRPDIRTAFEIMGLHSRARVILAAENEVAERIVGTLKTGDVVTASCWGKDAEWVNAAGEHRTGRVLHIDSFSLHPRDAP